ncbi:PREDICTED: tetratricopeptide repeat protein 36-like [Cyprinodon variegatus]|uniref:tetratricopeptide repeat protein 36-like n=1 Tax=Cyprinodon variegatus TaxID=28743 RepID=UPI00074286E0|nr:PREDICTED: tetratricopeptide repeat protein 36-like [Cyprinodon variegatus]
MASAHDRAVLQAIFNPTTPFGDVPGLNQEEELIDDDSGFDTELLKQVKELEMRGVSAAEAGELQAALQLFSQAVHILPQRASAYNNRAQALRLLGDTAGKFNKFSNKPSLRHCIVPVCQSVESEASIIQCRTSACLSSACYLH